MGKGMQATDTAVSGFTSTFCLGSGVSGVPANQCLRSGLRLSLCHAVQKGMALCEVRLGLLPHSKHCRGARLSTATEKCFLVGSRNLMGPHRGLTDRRPGRHFAGRATIGHMEAQNWALRLSEYPILDWSTDCHERMPGLEILTCKSGTPNPAHMGRISQRETKPMIEGGVARAQLLLR
jgi:hypothetical protein